MNHYECVLIIVEMPVPIAIIVCEGDLETIAHISKALEKKLPVIIMKGSGMAADLVLDYLDKYVKHHKILKRMVDFYRMSVNYFY